MDAVKIIRDANWRLDVGDITREQYEELIAPLRNIEVVRHGRWINRKCDKCGGHAPFWTMASTYYPSNYCPHCGADMRKDGERHDTK